MNTTTAHPLHEETAREFCAAIASLAANPEALDNLESYLSYHFGSWLTKHANTPEGITDELNMFAGIELPF